MSEKGVHVVHTIANGGIEDANGEDQRTGEKMGADRAAKLTHYGWVWIFNRSASVWRPWVLMQWKKRIVFAPSGANIVDA